MKNFCGARIDTQSMTLEELKEFRDKLEKVLGELNHDIKVRMMISAKQGKLSKTA